MVPEGWLTLATVMKPRGNKGELIVDLHTTGIERLSEVQSVSVFESASTPPKILEIEDAWMHVEKAVVKFAGVDSIDQANALRGIDLCIPLAARRQPKEGEVFLSDLIGCQIFDKKDSLLGTVEDIFEEGAQVWLQLDTNSALVPYVPAFFPSMDLPNKRLVSDLPEGLLEVNSQ
jgi:16S rRNA processing protein RimM